MKSRVTRDISPERVLIAPFTFFLIVVSIGTILHLALVITKDNPLPPPFLRRTLQIHLIKGGEGVVFKSYLMLAELQSGIAIG